MEKMANGERLPQISVAAWFPYHFVEPNTEPNKFPILPAEGLGIDSLGMLYITYGEDASAQAARVSPCINSNWIDSNLCNAEDSPTWNLQYVKEETNITQVFLKFSPSTGYPGPHSQKYQRSPKFNTLREPPEHFLEPHSGEDLLGQLDSTRHAAYEKGIEDYNAHRTSGSTTPFALNGLY